MIELGCSVITLVADLLQRHSEIESIRIRTFPLREGPPADVADLPLDRALRHNRDPEVVLTVPEPLSLETLREALGRYASPKTMLGLCSRFNMRTGATRHALMMDFRIPKSAESLTRVHAACNGIGYPGWLIETTNSFHFYGDDLVEEREWLRFMGRCLLVETLVDVRFVGHCIIECISCLRITADTQHEPVVIARIAAE